MKAAFVAHGRVQGVGFRWFVREQALELGLGGWVRNEWDGSVVGEVQGELGALDLFRERLEAGNTFGRVSRLDWTPSFEAQSLPLPFEVRH